MDKFEKRLNQVNMITPKGTLNQQSTFKQNDHAKSYASLNEFNRIGEQFDSEAVNLRSQVQILEGKLQFYEREFQIKQSSLEKRIQQLISTSSQLTQQNTQLKLQYQALLNEYQIQQDKMAHSDKGQKEYEEKVRSQLDNYNKYQSEKEQLIQYANKCRERSKQRKLKIKEITTTNSQLIDQIQQLEQELEQANHEKQQIYEQCQQQIMILTEQNEDWQMKYESIVQNFKNHLADQNDSQQEEQLLASHTILDQREAQTVQQQLENFSILQKDLNTLLSQIKNTSVTNPSSFEMQQVIEFAEIFNRMAEKIYELQQKKSMLKEQLKDLQQTQLQTQMLSNKSISNNQSPNMMDDRTKLLFEQRILELEEYYQKERQQEKNKPAQRGRNQDRKLKQIISILTQFLEEFLEQQNHLKTLNYQINDMQFEYNDKKCNRSFKKASWAIIAIYRIKTIQNQQYYQQVVQFNQLRIEMPIVNSLNQLLELVSGQQQLIDTLQKQMDRRGSDVFQEQDIQSIVDQELKQQLKSVQIELDMNNKKMFEYKLQSEKQIEERDRIINELEQQLRDFPNDYNQQLLEHLEEQTNRVKSIENEFNVLNELVNSLI
ncbi:unnamed protein product (macronuclear) [Paramecium tetraurelia]|uniref:Uncharacterized protein n=1 Tax=Paramecium tetraurelia TaxID=5888 RepID=A0CHD9_PARTE|nr:uncharacterized protein GSPATT00038308001 [Paramecium tetraurelia]CAK70206.1 unnamed protein product [Paramecium tetraurelia]|eukprot:XP_001437603.1 hypothetical protein (macronuclear) [Paramecium tetraurelia strain d4-2]